MYLHIFIWLFLVGFFVERSNIYNIEENANGEIIKYWKILPAVVLFFPVFWLACMGNPINDVPLYIYEYKTLPTTLTDAKDYFNGMTSGQGFFILEEIIKKLFAGSTVAFRVCIALIQSIPIIYIFRKYCEQYWIGIYIFVASACHIGWMMNGMRQFIAVIMIFSTLPWMIEGRKIRLIVVVGLAMTIHISAILMFPIVFIVQGKAWNKKTLTFIAISIALMFMFSRNVTLADTFLQGTEYAGSMSSMRTMGDDGVNPIRVIISAVPMMLSFINRKSIQKEENKLIYICVNMSVVTVGLNMIAMVTSGILVGRLAIYTSLYSFIIIPYLIRKSFTERSQKIVNGMLIILYFIYYCFEVGVL